MPRQRFDDMVDANGRKPQAAVKPSRLKTRIWIPEWKEVVGMLLLNPDICKKHSNCSPISSSMR
jgi:hypothetical protein